MQTGLHEPGKSVTSIDFRSAMRSGQDIFGSWWKDLLVRLKESKTHSTGRNRRWRKGREGDGFSLVPATFPEAVWCTGLPSSSVCRSTSGAAQRGRPQIVHSTAELWLDRTSKRHTSFIARTKPKGHRPGYCWMLPGHPCALPLRERRACWLVLARNFSPSECVPQELSGVLAQCGRRRPVSGPKGLRCKAGGYELRYGRALSVWYRTKAIQMVYSRFRRLS